MNITKWIDTHIHISAPKDYTTEMMVKGLEEFFANEAVELEFVASPGQGWIEKIAEGDILEMHTRFNDIIKCFPGKIHGSCMINPNYTEASLKMMDICFNEWGYVQLGELVTYLMDYKMNQPKTEALVRKANEYNVPIHIHVSTSNAKPQGNYESGEEELVDMLDLMDKLPNGKYIFTHGIGAPQISPPVIDTYLDIIDKRYGKWPENLWIEIIHFHAVPAVKSALSYIPIDRILSGTDWSSSKGNPLAPYGTSFLGADFEVPNPFEPSVNSLINLLLKAGVNENDIDKIAYKNAQTLYNFK